MPTLVTTVKTYYNDELISEYEFRQAIFEFTVLPALPVPTIPSIPSLPDIPTVPTVDKPEIIVPGVDINTPDLGAFVSFSFPVLPSIPLPTIPSTPSLPSKDDYGMSDVIKVDVPEINVPGVDISIPDLGAFPSFSFPVLPALPIPTLPTIPSLPDLPSLPTIDGPEVSRTETETRIE